MIIRKSQRDIERIARAGELLERVHDHIAPHVQPGITTLELDQMAEQLIREHGGMPTFKGYRGFPATLCTSPNHMVVHGIPGSFALKEGDLISIDCGVTLNGWVADCARSYVVGGSGNLDAQRLIDTAYEALEAGIAQCYVGNHIGDVGHAVQQVVEAEGFGVIRKLVGHGVGRSMHEDPQVPNFGEPGTLERLEQGYVFALEPMITLSGEVDVVEDEHDGWSIYTADGSLSAHVEHTIAITHDGALVLTRG